MRNHLKLEERKVEKQPARKTLAGLMARHCRWLAVMVSDDTERHTVTTNEQFIDELCEYYPAATSVSQAFAMAAQDGLEFRKSFGTDLRSYIRAQVHQEVCDAEDG